MGSDAAISKTNIKRLVGLALGIIAIVASCLFPGSEALTVAGARAIGVLFFCIFLWAFDTIPVGITGVLGAVLLFVLGVEPNAAASFAGFADGTVWFIFGIFCFTGIMIKTSLGQRLTSVFVKLAKGNSKVVVLSFMIATCILSMFMTDGGAVATVIAVAMPLLVAVDARNTRKNFGRCVTIGIAVGAIVGGFITPFGHALNVLCLGLMEKTYGITISFVQWFIPGFITALIVLPVCWLILCKVFSPEDLGDTGDLMSTMGGKDGFGPLSAIDKKALVFFAAVIALFVIGNWVPSLNTTKIIIIALALLFLPGINMMNWKEFVESEGWPTFLMVGGIMCVGGAINDTGAGTFIANLFIESGLFSLNVVAVLLIFVAIIYVIHTFCPIAPALCMLFVPPLMAFCVSNGISPGIFVMLMASITAGSFIMPFSPPMLMSFNANFYTIGELAKSGWMMAIVYVVVEVLVVFFVGGLVLPVI